MEKIRVLVNGVGTIGKRVAHAVKLQEDMELVGVADVSPTAVLRQNLEPEGFLYKTDLYASNEKGLESLQKAGFFVKGLLSELLKSGGVDVVADGSPAGVDKLNKELYERYGVRGIFQGGAAVDLAEVSFNSVANYDEAKGKKFVRVVSCNTTALSRTLFSIDRAIGIERARISIARRATDPWDSHEGPINSMVPDSHIPSHHGPDVKTILKNMDIKTMAVKVPSTLAHVHMCYVKLKREASRDEFVNAFLWTPRVKILKIKDGYDSTGAVIERFRDFGKYRGDMRSVAIWDETIAVDGDEGYWMHTAHSEAIVVPESIDCIRAMFELEEDNWKSIEKTDRALGDIK